MRRKSPKAPSRSFLKKGPPVLKSEQALQLGTVMGRPAIEFSGGQELVSEFTLPAGFEKSSFTVTPQAVIHVGASGETDEARRLKHFTGAISRLRLLPRVRSQAELRQSTGLTTPKTAR
jgi:hypothetical protein